MYTLDTADTEISEAAENFILNLLYEPETVELIENKIKNGEKQMKSLISAMRKLAKYLLKMEEVKNQKWVEEKNLEFAIPKVNIWPINLLKL